MLFSCTRRLRWKELMSSRLFWGQSENILSFRVVSRLNARSCAVCFNVPDSRYPSFLPSCAIRLPLVLWGTRSMKDFVRLSWRAWNPDAFKIAFCRNARAASCQRCRGLSRSLASTSRERKRPQVFDGESRKFLSRQKFSVSKLRRVERQEHKMAAKRRLLPSSMVKMATAAALPGLNLATPVAVSTQDALGPGGLWSRALFSGEGVPASARA
ncbi:unnamed protein product [Ixodes hexagonus]